MKLFCEHAPEYGALSTNKNIKWHYKLMLKRPKISRDPYGNKVNTFKSIRKTTQSGNFICNMTDFKVCENTHSDPDMLIFKNMRTVSKR